VKTSDDMKELRLTCSGPGLSFSGTLKLLDDHNKPSTGEQQIHLFVEGQASGEPGERARAQGG
jgi:hypothetical protein